MAFIRNVDKLIEGLENKFFTEQRAKDALAPELAAEEAAREAGDSAEAAARQSADNALSGRLDVIEGSGEGSVAKAEQDAKDYTDQKVAALVNSAPEVLDTLKELSDALGSDPNFATTVANNIGAVDAKVDQEILDRQSAVSAEQSARESADQALDGRLDLLEADSVTKAYVDGEVLDLQGQITQEISDRQAAVEAEEDARQLADSNLSDRIGVLEQDPTTKAYVDGEVLDLQGQITQEISDRQADVDAEETRAMSAESALSGRLDVLEQDPTTKEYVDGKVEMLEGEISDEETRAQAAESALSGRLDILEQDPTTKAYVDSKVEMLEGEVSDEESRAMLAEQGLQSDIDAEEVRAMAAESALDVRIDVLEQDPTTKTYVDGEVSDLQGQITQEIADRQSAVSTEQSRAVAAEEALDARLDVLEADPVTKSYVDSQDSGLQGQIDTEKGRIDAILSASEADKDSFAEIVQLINSVDTENDSAFASYVLSNDAALAQEISDRQADVNAEEQRAMAAEGLLDGRLDVLESDPTTKTYVDSEVSAEESRAITAEALLAGRLDVLEEDPTTKTYVDDEVSAEAAARSAEDLTMFKKDGSRNMAGNILFDSGDIGTSTGNKPGNIFTNGKIVNGYDASSSTDRLLGTGSAIYSGIQYINKLGGNAAINMYAYKTNTSPAINLGMTLGNIYFNGHDGTVNSPGCRLSVKSVETWNSSARGSQLNIDLVAKLNSNATTIFRLDWDNSYISSKFSAAGGLNLNAGSAGSPSVYFNNTTNGFSNHVSDSIFVQLNGSSKIRMSPTYLLMNYVGSGTYDLIWHSMSNPGSIGTSLADGPQNLYVRANGTFGGSIDVQGGQKVKYSAKSTNYTVTSSDYIVAVSDLSASKVMTLPSAVTEGAGKTFIIKDQSGAASQTNYIQIAPQSGELIDGEVEYKVVMPYESVMLVSNGTHWFII